MCNLKGKVKPARYKAKGWKVVAVRSDGGYFSPATGIRYASGRRLPVLTGKRPHILAGCFNECFLNPDEDWSGFRVEMEGRTAIYLRKKDAELSRAHMRVEYVEPGFTLKTIPAVVSDGVMLGTYGSSEPIPKVAAGKRIRFYEKQK